MADAASGGLPANGTAPDEGRSVVRTARMLQDDASPRCRHGNEISLCGPQWGRAVLAICGRLGESGN